MYQILGKFSNRRVVKAQDYMFEKPRLLNFEFKLSAMVEPM